VERFKARKLGGRKVEKFKLEKLRQCFVCVLHNLDLILKSGGNLRLMGRLRRNKELLKENPKNQL
jgi:hypothetical protein